MKQQEQFIHCGDLSVCNYYQIEIKIKYPTQFSYAHLFLFPQDYCGDKNSVGSFSIITENVPCGTTGVTCSKAIKMFLGVSSDIHECISIFKYFKKK